MVSDLGRWQLQQAPAPGSQALHHLVIQLSLHIWQPHYLPQHLHCKNLIIFSLLCLCENGSITGGHCIYHHLLHPPSLIASTAILLHSGLASLSSRSFVFQAMSSTSPLPIPVSICIIILSTMLFRVFDVAALLAHHNLILRISYPKWCLCPSPAFWVMQTDPVHHLAISQSTKKLCLKNWRSYSISHKDPLARFLRHFEG